MNNNSRNSIYYKLMKWNYPPEYLKKDGKLKKNCLKKAYEYRMLHPPKFQGEQVYNENIEIKTEIEIKTDIEESFEQLSYPSYQHMPYDIIIHIANTIIKGNTCDYMNSFEECEMFRCFCIMNKRLCLLNKTFRKTYCIKEKIEKCKSMKKTIQASSVFKRMATRNGLPVNKEFHFNYQKKVNVYTFIKTYYSSYASRYGDRLMFNTLPIIKTLNDYNNVKIKSKHNEYTLCIITEELAASNQDMQAAGQLIVSNGLKNTIPIHSYIQLIETFAKYPVFFETFIIDLRKNYYERRTYYDCKLTEKEIQYFIKTLIT